MALGDGTGWDETTPTNDTVAVQIDDYNRDLRIGVRSRMDVEHEWPASQAAVAEAGMHKYITFQQQATKPTLAGTQEGACYFTTDDTYVIESSDGTLTTLVEAGGGITPRAGQVLQEVNDSTGGKVDITTTMPFNAFIPQITEGDEVFSRTITPSDATNQLSFVVGCQVGHHIGGGGNSQIISAALFQDTTADAVAIAVGYVNNLAMAPLCFPYVQSAGTTGERTYTVRVGGSAAGTVHLNGARDTAIGGGSPASYILIQEIKG